MLKFGLIGNPVAHSQSRTYFLDKFQREGIDADYGLYCLERIEDFPELCTREHFSGLNVTAPYKQAIIPYLDELDESASCIQAVNVIRFRSDGRLVGYNTDLIGFRESIRPLLGSRKKALVFGTGGASLAVVGALNKLEIEAKRVSRNPERQTDQTTIAYTDITAQQLQDSKLLINATPLGMTPHENEMPPIPYEELTNEHLLYDLVYNPAKTRFLQTGEAHGAQIKNGEEMHHLQAEASWAIWDSTGRHISEDIHIRPATLEDAAFIARHVLQAITLQDDIEESAIAELTPICLQEDTLYSYRNALIAEIEETGNKESKTRVGLALAYPGERYHAMRAVTFPQISYFKGTDSESMPDETIPGEYYLDSLSVDSKYKGRGIGRKLLQTVKKEALDRDLTASLLVEPDNNRALRLYTSEGFTGTELRPAFGHNYRVMKIKK